jgi:hypothetical protein
MMPDEILQEIKGLRGDIQALPERIVSVLAKEVKREARYLWLAVVILVLFDWLFRTLWK